MNESFTAQDGLDLNEPKRSVPAMPAAQDEPKRSSPIMPAEQDEPKRHAPVEPAEQDTPKRSAPVEPASSVVAPEGSEAIGQSVVLPWHWFAELLALCGPEQHELRERVSNSVRPATAGWKLVPAEPTDEMLNAAHEVAYVLRHNEWRYTEAKRYAAMLAAAPCNSPATCPHADEPRGCFRVRCQLGNKCVGEPE